MVLWHAPAQSAREPTATADPPMRVLLVGFQTRPVLMNQNVSRGREVVVVAWISRPNVRAGRGEMPACLRMRRLVRWLAVCDFASSDERMGVLRASWMKDPICPSGLLDMEKIYMRRRLRARYLTTVLSCVCELCNQVRR